MAGLLFWGNRGVKRDLKAAVKYYDMGAKNEDPDSTYNLGIVHLRVSIPLGWLARNHYLWNK